MLLRLVSSETNLITLYGIPNCDTVKKARRWLDQHSIEYRFHDFRADGLEAADVERWLAELGWETLVNRGSTSWKQLDAGRRESMDNSGAGEAILATPTLIKRPLLDTGRDLHVGFSEAEYKNIFQRHTL
jgi:Spx/MgsR family transcriptional regulator